MLARIVASMSYIATWFKEGQRFSLLECVPSAPVLSALAGALAAGWSLTSYSSSALAQIGTGAASFAIVTFVVYRHERELLGDLKKLWSGKL